MTQSAIPYFDARQEAARLLVRAESEISEAFMMRLDTIARYLATGELPGKEKIETNHVREVVENVRRFHFEHNPPNTGLAIGFNAILKAIDEKQTPAPQ